MTGRVSELGLIILLSAVCLTSVAAAQTSWWKTYGGAQTDEGRCVQQTTDGGYVIAGFTHSFGPGTPDSSNVYLVRTDASGDTLWTRVYGGTGRDEGYSVQQTTDGGYVIAGYTNSFGTGNGDVYLVKTNASGDTLWTRTFGGTDYDEGASVQQTADGGYIVAGRTYSFGAGSDDVYLIKTNAQGDTSWTRAYGEEGIDEGYSVQQTADGGYIVAGYVYRGDFEDACLIKTNASGDTLWTRTYGPLHEAAFSVQQTTDGGYIVAGLTANLPMPFYVYLFKTNAQGDSLWARTYGRGVGHSVQQTADGGYILAGGTSSVCLVRTSPSGDTLWTRTYGGVNYSALQTSDGGYITAGSAASFGAGASDVYLIKTDSLGNVGVAEESHKPPAMSRKLAATAVRSLVQGTVAFDVMGRRVLHPKPGIYFLRTTPTAAAEKVLLIE